MLGLPATARLIHRPSFVALNHAAEGFCRRDAFVNVDRDGHVAEGKRRAVVRLFAREAELPLHRLGAVRGRKAQAVFVAADVKVILHRFVSVG